MDVTDVRRVLKERRNEKPKTSAPSGSATLSQNVADEAALKFADGEPSIEFQPLHSGLGFHPPDPIPVSPGSSLPMSPSKALETLVTSTQVTPGPASGRSSAPSSDRSSVPKKLPQTTSTPNSSLGLSSFRPGTRTDLEALIRTPSIGLPLAQTFGWDYLGRRILSFLADILFQNVALGTGLGFLGWQLGLEYKVFLRPDLLPPLVLGAIGFNWLLLTFQDLAFRASIGKEIFGLTLRGSSQRIFLRCLLLPLSFLSGGLGLLMAVFHPRSQAFHDWASGTQPEEVAEL